MPDTPIDLSEGIQSVRLKVPTAEVPIPPEGFAQLHSPAPGELALRLPDGSVVPIGGGGGGPSDTLVGSGGIITAAAGNGPVNAGLSLLVGAGLGIYQSGPFINASGLPSGVQVAPVPISSSELLSLHTTPKQIVAAQGAGTLIVPLHALWVGLGGTAYANDDVAAFNLYLGTDPTDFPMLAGDASVHLALPNFVHRSDFNYSGQIGAGGPPYNLPLNLKLTEAITGGTAPLLLFIAYLVVWAPAA